HVCSGECSTETAGIGSGESSITVPPPRETQESAQEDQASTPHPTADIQAILTVLGRRDRKYEREGQVLNLTDTDIRGADLSGANLSRANLGDAKLSRADLSR